MLDELHPTARSLAASWLAHTNPDKVKMPTDIDPAIARALLLGQRVRGVSAMRRQSRITTAYFRTPTCGTTHVPPRFTCSLFV